MKIFLLNILKWRWCAPEILADSENREKHFSEKSDVYSFGLTVWEMFSKGKEPFGNISAQEIVKGARPPISKLWPEVIRVLLKDCWHQNLSKRPTFQELHERLFDDSDTKDIYLNTTDSQSIEMESHDKKGPDYSDLTTAPSVRLSSTQETYN